MSQKRARWFHDVLGESPRAAEVAVILVVGAAFATWFVSQTRDLAPWRAIVAWLLVADVAAGSVANFTSSTNDFYARRPINRWLFIAGHVHVLLLGWLVGAAMAPALAVWAYTLCAATITNAAAGASSQRFLGGVLLVAGLVLLAVLDLPVHLGAAYAIYFVKVAYAFAVDHRADAPAAGEGLAELGHRDRRAFARLIAGAFAADPLFAATVGEGAGARRRAEVLAAFLFDAILLAGGTAHGLFVGGRLIGVSLVERPRVGRRAWLGDVAAALRFLPAWPVLGSRASRLLNRYQIAMRAAAPPSPHHRLAMLGVAPASQGGGIGRRLLDHVIAQADADPRSTGVVLDTENAENVRFYRAAGFTEEAVIPLDGIEAHVLRRRKA